MKWARVGGALLLGASIGVFGQVQSGQANQRQRDFVRVACPKPVAGLSRAQTEGVCQQIIQEIAKIAQGRIVRRVVPGDARPARAGELGIVFELVEAGGGQVRGVLSVIKGPDGPRQTGAPVLIPLVAGGRDAPQIAQNLVRSTPAIKTTLLSK